MCQPLMMLDALLIMNQSLIKIKHRYTKIFDIEKHQISDKIMLEVSATGGHVGFLQGTPWRPELWLPGRIKHYIDASY